MTFISYAQNFEDVMLSRALKHVSNGFYIDVGAAWPDEHSVTKAFYDRGWHGINIEPNPELLSLLQKDRPKDKNLGLAIGDHEGSLVINILADTGLSTLDPAIAIAHTQAGRNARSKEISVTTLEKIWLHHVASDQAVHFLKVDVEGLEKQVLQGNDWISNRPWIVLVEATLPMSQVENFTPWEPILTSSNYQFVYADGLNRYYIAKEHSDLMHAFKYPPNVFDGFISAAQFRSEGQLEIATTELKKTNSKLVQTETKIEQLAAELQAIYNSRSWRITKPLRSLTQLFRKFLSSNLPKSFIQKFLQLARNFLRHHPKLQRAASKLLHLSPKLKNRLVSLTIDASLEQTDIPTNLKQLTAHGRQIYQDLTSSPSSKHQESTHARRH